MSNSYKRIKHAHVKVAMTGAGLSAMAKATSPQQLSRKHPVNSVHGTGGPPSPALEVASTAAQPRFHMRALNTLAANLCKVSQTLAWAGPQESPFFPPPLPVASPAQNVEPDSTPLGNAETLLDISWSRVGWSPSPTSPYLRDVAPGQTDLPAYVLGEAFLGMPPDLDQRSPSPAYQYSPAAQREQNGSTTYSDEETLFGFSLATIQYPLSPTHPSSPDAELRQNATTPHARAESPDRASSNPSLRAGATLAGKSSDATVSPASTHDQHNPSHNPLEQDGRNCAQAPSNEHKSTGVSPRGRVCTMSTEKLRKLKEALIKYGTSLNVSEWGREHNVSRYVLRHYARHGKLTSEGENILYKADGLGGIFRSILDADLLALRDALAINPTLNVLDWAAERSLNGRSMKYYVRNGKLTSPAKKRLAWLARSTPAKMRHGHQ